MKRAIERAELAENKLKGIEEELQVIITTIVISIIIIIIIVRVLERT